MYILFNIKDFFVNSTNFILDFWYYSIQVGIDDFIWVFLFVILNFLYDQSFPLFLFFLLKLISRVPFKNSILYLIIFFLLIKKKWIEYSLDFFSFDYFCIKYFGKVYLFYTSLSQYLNDLFGEIDLWLV